MPGSPRLLEERRTRSRSKRHTVLVFDGTLWYGEGTEGTHPYNIVTNPQKGYTVMTKVTPTPGIVEAASAAYMSETRSRGVDNHMHLIEVAVTAAFNHPETSGLFVGGNGPAHSDLPHKEGSVIVKKSDKIQARHAGKTWTTSEAVLVCGEWRGTWLEEGCEHSQRGVMWAMSPERIIPDTWKVDRK